MKKLTAVFFALMAFCSTMTGFACPGEMKDPAVGKKDCTFGEWEYSKYATPFESGERYKVCSACNKRVSEVYTIKMSENSIYIPGTGVHGCFANSWLTQSAVDRNDMVYTEQAYRYKDENNPFILGHWYGSLSTLHQTQVGQNIYICVNGKIETYEVVVSEYAVEDSRRVQIIGQATGVNVWDTLGSEPASQYTSYGCEHGGKNILDEESNGKTLHMYTCYYNRGEPWKQEDGRSGRWIVLASLVDTVYVDNTNNIAVA